MADLIIHNAKVYTVDGRTPHAQAVAVKGNRIIFVGSDEDVNRFRGANTRLIDGAHRTLMPGFIDSHFHLMGGSLGLSDAQVRGVKTLEDLKTVIQTFAAENPDLPWLVGQGLAYNIPSDEEPLTRHHLDQIEPDRPLALVAYDVHTVWANTTALQQAGLLSGTGPLPGSAEVVLADDGLACGELREPAAYDLLLQHIPRPDETRKLELLRQGLKLAASLGITSVHNMDGDLEQANLYATLEALGELTLRVYLPYSVTPETPFEALAADAVTMRDNFKGDLLRGGAVKFFMDGVFESYTALVLNDYPDQPGIYGEPIFSFNHFKQMTLEADRLGLQIFTHACGDAAVRCVLDGYEAARHANRGRDSRHRVEHIELIHPDDAPRFAELDVIASMQPLHSPLLENDPDVWPKRIRKQDWNRSFAWRSLREAGAYLAFGSDWPVVTLDPFMGLHAALNRQPWEPSYNAHTQTLEEAIAGYTRDAAYAEFQENKKGQIKVGLWADLVLLSDDIFAVPPEKISAVRPVLTVCNGRIVYQLDV